MAPHRALIELAADRPLARFESAVGLVESAIEHRMAGLLWTRVARGEITVGEDEERRLREWDIETWARNRMLLDVSLDVAAIAADLGIVIAFIKGVTAELRWYNRLGERPSSDIDIVVAPNNLARAPEFLSALHPGHSLQRHLGELISQKSVQSVDLSHRGLPVDLHLDPLKLEVVWCRRPDQMWERAEEIEVQPSRRLHVFSPEVSLIQGAMHLNKDRFRYLLGFADVARILQREHIDWPFVEQVVDSEGLRTPVALALQTVHDTLRLDADVRVNPPRSSGARLWRITWPEDTRLLGDEGLVRYRYRQFLIPFTGTGRTGEATRGWVRRLAPPPSLLDHYYPDLTGPYAWKLLAGRINSRMRRHRIRHEVMHQPALPLKAGATDGLPTISVVTPSYQQGQYIEETIRSVLDQGYPKLEYIVMDGGSTDESVEIIRRYADRLTYWSSGPDGGQTPALIEGFKRATGDILCWVNSDDLLEPSTLWEVGSFFRDHPGARAVYGDGTWIDTSSRPIQSKREHPFNRFIFIYDHDFIPQPSMFWRRDLYEQVGGLDPQFDLAMDADLFIRFADVTRLHHFGRVWSRMRRYPEQKNQRLRARSNAEGAIIRRRYVRPQRRATYLVKRRAARALRIGWKLVTGRYR